MGVVKLTSPSANSSLSGLETRVSELEYGLKQFKSKDQAEIQGEDISGGVKNKESVEKPSKQKNRYHKEKNEASSTVEEENTVDSNNTTNKEKNDLLSDSDKNKIKKDDSSAEASSKKRKMAGFSPGEGEAKLTIAQVRKSWPAILSNLKDEDIKTHAFLVEGKPADVEGDQIYIEFAGDKKFHKKGAARNRSLVKRVVGSILNQSCNVEFITTGEKPGNNGVDNEPSDKENKKKVQNDELVDRVIEMFDGKVVEAREEILEN
jgi:hypothetical protein